MTTAKVNDRKTVNQLPLLSNATYVFDRAYNDYRWYYERMHLKGNRFAGRMKSNAQYEVLSSQAVENNVREDQTILLTSSQRPKLSHPYASNPLYPSGRSQGSHPDC